MIPVDTLLGLFGGFALSFLLWWWLNHSLVPSVKFSEEIAKQPTNYSPRKSSHIFAFQNTGKRSILNIRIKARLRILDPRKQGEDETNYFDIVLPNNEIFELKPGVVKWLPLLPFKSSSLTSPILSSRISNGLNEETLTLDEIMEDYPQAEVFVHLICTDVYSNASKVFRSCNYSKSDIRIGKFNSGSLDVSPL